MEPSAATSQQANAYTSRAHSGKSSQALSLGDWHPTFDIKLTPNRLTAYIDLPDVDEDEVNVKVIGDKLTITGERDFDHDREDAEEFTVLDRPYGEFKVELALPPSAIANDVRARYKRGVLRIQVPLEGRTS